MDLPNRISSTPLYEQESLEEMLKKIDSQVGQPASFVRTRPLKGRNLQTKYLNKRHRFFKAKVNEEDAEIALEAIEEKLKELIDRYNGDLHVCKLSGKNEITAYFITNDDVHSEEWGDELRRSIMPYMANEEPSLMQLKPMH